jgi:hypothetical protein
MRPRISAAIFALLLAAGAAPHCSPAWLPPWQVSLSDEDLLLDDPYAGHFRSRFWYFNAALVDGTDLTLSLFQWRYGLIGEAGLLVLSTEPGAETFALETKLEELEAAPDRLRYSFGESVLEGDREWARLRLRLPDFSCDLELRNLLNPWKPGDGFTRLNRRGDVYTRLSVTSPFAEVTGSMTVRGQWRPVLGWGYADRGVVTMPMSRINPEQSTFRVFGGQGEPWMLSVSESAAHRAYGSQRSATLLLARGGEWLMATSEHEFQAEEYRKEEGAPFPFPHRFRLRARQDDRTLEGVFTVSRLYYLNDILKKLPPVFRPSRGPDPAAAHLPPEGGFSGILEEADGSQVILQLGGQGEYQIMR